MALSDFPERKPIAHPTGNAPWIGTGWKMNKTLGEAREYARDLRAYVAATDLAATVFIVPPFTVLSNVCEELEGSPVLVGAQNAHWEDTGAYTGEISCRMVADCGAEMLEIGHSERRRCFSETDVTVHLKVRAALRHGLRPLICVGETAEERAHGVAVDTVNRQVAFALHGLSAGDALRCALAYEPVWAIGEGGSPASPDEANLMHAAIRRRVSELFGAKAARNIPLLYGGSVTSENAVGFLREPEVDGLFIGRAAWSCEGFLEILGLAERYRAGAS